MRLFAGKTTGVKQGIRQGHLLDIFRDGWVHKKVDWHLRLFMLEKILLREAKTFGLLHIPRRILRRDARYGLHGHGAIIKIFRVKINKALLTRVNFYVRRHRLEFKIQVAVQTSGKKYFDRARGIHLHGAGSHGSRRAGFAIETLFLAHQFVKRHQEVAKTKHENNAARKEQCETFIFFSLRSFI